MRISTHCGSGEDQPSKSSTEGAWRHHGRRVGDQSRWVVLAAVLSQPLLLAAGPTWLLRLRQHPDECRAIFLEDKSRFYYGGHAEGATGGDDITFVKLPERVQLIVTPESILDGCVFAAEPDMMVEQYVSSSDRVRQLYLVRARALSREPGIYLAIGFPERAGEELYNLCVLTDKQGEISATYRRVHSEQVAREAEPRAETVQHTAWTLGFLSKFTWRSTSQGV